MSELIVIVCLPLIVAILAITFVFAISEASEVGAGASTTRGGIRTGDELG